MATYLQKGLVYVSATVWMVALVLMGVGVPDKFWQPVGIVSLVVSALTFLYDRFMWAWVPEKLGGAPDLRGTWRARLLSNWIDPAAGTRADAIEAYVVIGQTASSIVVTMLTKESRSATLLARLDGKDGGTEVVGVYRNETQANVRGRSPIHFGGLRLHVGGPPSTTLGGTYWTDRATTGDLDLEFCTRERARDFSTAQALCVGQLPAGGAPTR